MVRTGGKQYRAEPNQLLDVERLPAAVGGTVELLDVLLLSDGEKVTIGQPTVAGARVVAEVVEHGRDKKIVVFKYKSKTRYHKKTGHRQGYTRLAIRQILTGEEPKAAPKAPPKRRRRRVAPKAAAEPPVEAPPEAAVETAVEPPAEAAPAPAEAPKRRRRKAAEPEAVAPEEAPKPRRRKVATPKASAQALEEPKPQRRRARTAEKAAAEEEKEPRPRRRTKRGE